MIGAEELEHSRISPRINSPIDTISNTNTCLKYKNTKNLPCNPRPFPSELNSINFKPSDLNSYINDHFNTPKSPFVFKENYKKDNMDSLCFKESFELNPSQKFLGMHINNLTNFNGILVYHGMGSGKSCSSIVIAEANKFAFINNQNKPKLDNRYNTKNLYQIYVVVPKNVAAQYKEEIKGSIKKGCTNSCIIDDSEQIYSGNPEFIDKIYHITTHDKFLNSLFYIDKNSGNFIPTKTLLELNIFHNPNTLIIIDEIHTIIREYTQTNTTQYKKLYYFLMYYARLRENGNPAMKVVLLTGTPIYDNPFQAGLIINLLRPRIPFPTNSIKFKQLFINNKDKSIKNKLLFKYMTSGYISYFKGGNPNAFPLRKNHFIESFMAEKQENSYHTSLLIDLKKIENKKKEPNEDVINKIKEKEDIVSYFIFSSQKSNIAFPSTSNDDVLINPIMLNNFYKLIKKSKDPRTEISKWSNKFLKIVDLTNNSPGPVFIYSRFVSHGILAIASILLALGWNFFPFINNKDKPTFGVWSSTALDNLNLIGIKNISGDSDQLKYVSRLKDVFNSKENIDGSLCKVIISSVTEGISLRRVAQVHICEPWWNNSQIEQIVTRGIRFCSHSDSPNKEVNVYYHISKFKGILPGIETKLFSSYSIDQIIYRTSFRKNKLNIQFETALKESAIDCNLNKHGNIIRLEEMNFPSLPSLLYNRTNDTFYLPSPKNKLEVRKVTIDYDIWPPTNYSLTKSGLRFTSTDYIMTEKIECFIEKNLNFSQLRTLAIKNGEDESAWNYCYNIYLMNKLLPQVIHEYKIFKGGSSKRLTNHLFKLLINPEKYNLDKETQRNIEKFIFKPNTFFAKQNYKNFLAKNGFTTNKLNKMNIAQLEYNYFIIKNKK